jgi:hypothetical protein
MEGLERDSPKKWGALEESNFQVFRERLDGR